MGREIDDSTRVVESEVGDSMVREYVTVHDSTVGDGCGIYERTSLKKCHVSDDVEINAGCYVENAEIGDEAQIGPNSSIVGVTHNLGEDGMELRNDVFERIILHDGAFVGAGAVIAPGVEIGPNAVVAAGSVVSTDIGERRIVVGSPPTQEVSHLRDWL